MSEIPDAAAQASRRKSVISPLRRKRSATSDPDPWPWHTFDGKTVRVMESIMAIYGCVYTFEYVAYAKWKMKISRMPVVHMLVLEITEQMQGKHKHLVDFHFFYQQRCGAVTQSQDIQTVDVLGTGGCTGAC